MERRTIFLLFIVLAAKGSNGAGCGYPGAPAHSSVRFTGGDIDDVIDEEDALLKDTTFPEGTVATYSCERGFELLGPSRRECQAGGTWVPEGVPFCVLNVAAGKAPMQSSTPDGSGAIPHRAVDGSTSQRFTPQTCTLTKPEHKPWWYVNLLEPYMVQLVRLDFGKQCCGNIPGTIVVRVGNNRPDLGTNPICNEFTGSLEEGQPLFLPCNPPMPGAFVSVHLEIRGSAFVELSLCEAFVYTDQALPIERCPQFRDQPPGSTATYNGKCYIFYNRNPLMFNDALTFCRDRGGTLVDESNPALQGFLSWELWRRHRGDTSSHYWLGAVRDQRNRMSWRWTGSSEEVSVSFWDPPPGLTEEDCARYNGSNGWLWATISCLARLNFICQHQPKACGRPEQPPNSTMTVIRTPSRTSGNVYQVGATVEYSCNEGSFLIGPASRTCLDTGFYNEFPPVCKSIECGYPASIKHGGYTLINNTVSYFSQVLYSCEDGYEMIGRARLTCDIDERWNGPPPRCEPMLCDPPAAVAHGSFRIDDSDKDESARGRNNVNRSLLVNSVVTYSCDTGYRLVGSQQITCLNTGLYDRAVPTCTEEPRIVSSPTRPTTRSSTQKIRTYLTPRIKTTTSTVSTVSVSSKNVPNTAELPATVRETVSRRPSIGLNRPALPSSVPSDAGSDHPQDNEISGSGVDHAQAGIGAGVPEPSGPFRVDSAEHPNGHQAKLNLGAVIALGVFGGFVFLAAVITTVVILIRRNRGRSSKHYRHRASPDCNTVASFDSSSSESRGGLNRYYRQAWENLHETTGHKAGHPPLRRKETLDEPGYRENFRGNNTERDGSELVVSDVAAYPSSKHASVSDKKRHHHHHHHHHGSATPDWRQSQSHHRY
ncbi:PREDICTED: uncharacterized protein LOC105558062 [Vollenhovia emeryi]|uniref:uncharacterized protein LOC105558062 n=1 Tax=Vollenhovia emeryi TaxID=411798 RepID=UPI0005F36578|nr:PREDICTED: uncharacterized protein LOC105558062 [Vollenhovia emeryi]